MLSLGNHFTPNSQPTLEAFAWGIKTVLTLVAFGFGVFINPIAHLPYQ
jgi:hypothetical protein